MTIEILRRFVQVAGRRVSYLTVDGAPPSPALLLVHGSGVSARYWVHQLRGVGQALRVIALDLPGHGQSEPLEEDVSVEAYACAVADFLGALGAGPVIVAGHSLGAAVAIDLAARRPDAVSGLVLLSGCARLPWKDGPAEALLAWLPGPLRKVVFSSMAKKILFAAGASSDAVSLGTQELRACRPQTMLQDVQAARRMDLAEQATRVGVPTLVVTGSRDRLTPPALAEALALLIPGARLTIVEGAGHMVLLEAPDRVNEALRSLARVVAEARVAPPTPSRRPSPSLLRRLLERCAAVLRLRTPHA